MPLNSLKFLRWIAPASASSWPEFSQPLILIVIFFAGFTAKGADAPSITSPLFQTAAYGVAFSYQITASASPTGYSATSLPPGLAINSSTGVISGAPIQTGMYHVTIGATNAGGTGSATLSLLVQSHGEIQTTVFSYAGTSQNIVVPSGRVVTVKLWAAGGGSNGGSKGGTGGFTWVSFVTSTEKTFAIYVGGKGASGGNEPGGGGGRSEIRDGTTSIAIAGGGGGGGKVWPSGAHGGAGGGIVGRDGTNSGNGDYGYGAPSTGGSHPGASLQGGTGLSHEGFTPYNIGGWPNGGAGWFAYNLYEGSPEERTFGAGGGDGFYGGGASWGNDTFDEAVSGGGGGSGYLRTAYSGFQSGLMLAGTNGVGVPPGNGDADYATGYGEPDQNGRVVVITSLADLSPPTAPSNLQATNLTPTTLTLSWDAAADNVGVTSYQVFRGHTLLGTSFAPSFNVTGLDSLTYGVTLTVRAGDAAGNWSPEAALSLSFSDATAPAAPATVNYADKSATSVTLVWSAATDNAGVSGYYIYRGGTLVGTTSELIFADMNLSANTAYSYTVKAFDAAGNLSAASAALNVTTTADFSADTDQDGLPNATETALGTNGSAAASPDTTNQTQQTIHRPTP